MYTISPEEVGGWVVASSFVAAWTCYWSLGICAFFTRNYLMLPHFAFLLFHLGTMWAVYVWVEVGVFVVWLWSIDGELEIWWNWPSLNFIIGVLHLFTKIRISRRFEMFVWHYTFTLENRIWCCYCGFYCLISCDYFYPYIKSWKRIGAVFLVPAVTFEHAPNQRGNFLKIYSFPAGFAFFVVICIRSQHLSRPM